MLSIFGFDKIPNSTGIALKRLEGRSCRDYTFIDFLGQLLGHFAPLFIKIGGK